MSEDRSSSINEQGLYDPLSAMHLSDKLCFLCGAQLDSNNRSDEHVFPEWLLHKYGLWNSRSVLLNRTDLPYRSLTIPCCVDCNTRHLSSIERQVAGAVNSGFNAFAALPDQVVFLWLAKIAYGHSFKQGFLKWDRTTTDADTILDEDILEMFRILHIYLQAVRHQFEFTRPPYSIFRFRMLHPEQGAPDVDWKFGFFHHSVMVRMNDIGVVALLLDNGWARTLAPHHEEFWDQRECSHLQLLEVLAQVHYGECRIRSSPKYIFVGHANLEGPITAFAAPRNGYLPEPPQDEWNGYKYARHLAQLWECSVEDIYDPDRGVITLLPSGFCSPD